ncbi:sigma-54 interaction domain-containing protein [Desulfitobacterium metallireducens]|uniref:ArsR family transcriptional regulator n=1 Tax=Desulfitobacterium metallireducens DSM 15288 TaxID=871968 RepID=W0EE49_9FIRM|nr:ArsR family transcriptional regulator [Desulfitobacterium metallireducens DSM 15288]
MLNTQEEVLEAWKTFIARGIILEDKVRPEIARSWERCKANGMDPWSLDFPIYSQSLLKEKRTKYAQLLTLSGPIMNFLLTLLDCNISICNLEGFVFELITPLKHYPRSLGTYANEFTSGNGAVTIALNEKIAFRTDGFEHYRMVSQTYSDVSVPIHSNSIMIGALNAVNPFSCLPNQALPMIIAADKILENLLDHNEGKFKPFIDSKSFQEMIDCSSLFVIVINQEGVVLAENLASEQLWDPILLKNKSFENSLIYKGDLSLLLDKDTQNVNQRDFLIKELTTSKKQSYLHCVLLRKNRILLPNGDIYSVLVFDPFSAKDETGNPCNFSSKPPKYCKPTLPKDVDYIGESPAWTKVDRMIHKTAQFPSNVLLQGETGTGKEVVAKAIHRISQRKGSFVAINCGALPKELLQSELFGYEEGAFTGARTHGSIGKFEHAHEGTLLLDEIGEMPLDMQVALLRFLQERTITRINSTKSKKVDVRIIAATNKNMAELVKAGQFRQDLYYRLNVIEIELPPLRERKSDIPLLANYFISELSKQLKMQPKEISDDALKILCQYNWPGNVRELKNVIEKAMILSEDEQISSEILSEYILHWAPDSSSSKDEDSVEKLSERDHIIQLLEKTNGNIFQTAKALNIARNTLYRKIEKLNIKIKTSALKDSK